MLLAFFRPALLALALAVPVSASAAGVEDLSRTLRLDEMVKVMRAEGLAYGDDLASELLGGSGGPRWEATVGKIYDVNAMQRQVEAALDERLGKSADAVDAMVKFFGSDLGQKILSFEVSARYALLDEAVEDAAKVMLDDLESARDPRVDQLRAFAEANDLIESNVMGAMNANIAFYRGLAAGNAFPSEMTEEEILADVWSQEADIRDETETWLFPYLALAYEQLSDDELDAYIAFSQTPPGQSLNAALFAGFDTMFTHISRDLGMAIADHMRGEDI